MNSLEKLYYWLPVPLQNIAVSLKGLQLKRIRKRGAYEEYKRQITNRNDWRAGQFESYQLEQLNRIVQFASKNIPYYQRKYGTDIGTLDSLNTFRTRIPVLPREIVRSNPNDFISANSNNPIVVQTTGTTGSPLKVVCDADSRQKNYAFFDAYLESLGLNTTARHIIIGGRVVVPPSSIKPPFWRDSKFQKSLLMSSYHLSDKFIDSYIDKIAEFKPEYIEAYPSSIYVIARHMHNTGRQLKIKAIVTSAETLYPEQREIIEQSFQCKIYDQYGCAEMCLFVGQCTEGKYHIRPDYGFIEIIDDHGHTAPLGELGNVVCTGFINKQMPLIRYIIGDRAALDTNQTCNCGLNTPILSEISGRKDDMLITGDGRYVGRMSPVLKGLPVKEAQYIQNIPGEVLVNIVPDKMFKTSRDTISVVEAVTLRLGKNTRVKVNLVQDLVRGKGGKIKAVISNINKNYR